jgi:hypothetical protein
MVWQGVGVDELAKRDFEERVAMIYGAVADVLQQVPVRRAHIATRVKLWDTTRLSPYRR